MLKRFFCLAALTLLALFTWWVLWFMVMGALTGEGELLATIGPALQSEEEQGAVWCLLPSWPTLQPLVQLLLDTPVFFAMFWNACKLVFPQVAGQMAVAAPAAWAFSKLRFPGRQALYAVYLVLMVLPFQITMVPNYLVLNKLGLMDTPFAVILPGVFSAFPVFIIKKGFDAGPQSLLEAAALDGAGPLRKIMAITLPTMMPIITFQLIMSLGSILNNDFEQILMYYNAGVYEVADIIDTWVYRVGLGKMQYSIGQAVTMMKAVIGMVLILSSNYISNKVAGRGMW